MPNKNQLTHPISKGQIGRKASESSDESSLQHHKETKSTKPKDTSGGSSNHEHQIQTMPISELKPYANNARTHTKKQIKQIARSLKRFGWTNPLQVDENNVILAGHGRLAAAQSLSLAKVPVLQLKHLSEAEKTALRLADNKLAENAGWDHGLLSIEIQDLIETDIDFDLELTGFETVEIDLLLGFDQSQDEEDVPEPDIDVPAVNEPGDLWLIGPHRLICGDSQCPKAWQKLMNGETAQMVFMDPPYNVRITGNVSGLGKKVHREFAMASGELSPDAFTHFQRRVYVNSVEHSDDGAIHYICMDWRHYGELLAATDGVYSELKNLCVWAKTNAGMGTFYRSQHELVFVFKAGTAPHINNFGLGETGRHRSNLWTYAGANTFRKGRSEDLAAHPTVKPIAMVVDAIMDCSHRNGIILDGFVGSGTTLLAAARTGRRGFGIEIDSHYADLTIERLQKQTGSTAMHAQCAKSFDEMRAARLEEEARVE